MNQLFIYKDATGVRIEDPYKLVKLPRASVEITLNPKFYDMLYPHVHQNYRETIYQMAGDRNDKGTTYYKAFLAKIFRINFSMDRPLIEMRDEIRENWDTAAYRDGYYEKARNNKAAMLLATAHDVKPPKTNKKAVETTPEAPATEETAENLNPEETQHAHTETAEPIRATRIDDDEIQHPDAVPAEAPNPAPAQGRRRRVTIIDRT